MIPLHPKRRLVSPRAYGREPQDHQMTRSRDRASTFGVTIDPWKMSTLMSVEQFNTTAGER